MSRRTADASKAIRLAWEQEQQRILNGEGTRNWTIEQQQDIIDKGKAYDEDGKAFEGQHMKSAAEYPEYQGDPGNIQFLTHQEHFEAHRGNWQTPTNWYYDPVTKEFVDFGDGLFVPCKVIELSDPVYSSRSSTFETEEGAVETQNDEITKGQTKSAEYSSNTPALTQAPSNNNAIVKPNSFFGKIGQFFANHPGLTKGLITAGKIASTIGGAVLLYVASKGSSNSSSDSDHSENDYLPCDLSDDYDDPVSDDIAETTEERNYPDERSSPCEHDVSGYDRIQNGKKVHVNQYKRGGKKQ